jgi:O-antigen/teichoic acid export membrane protein
MADSTDQRDESELERLDRNTTELVNELRVAGTGVQVLFAFLLIVPFNNRWARVSGFDRHVYYVTLLCVAIATVLLIAPSVHHRLLFRRGEKEFVVGLGNRLAVLAAVFLAVGLTGILVLVSDFVFGGVAAAVVGGATAALLGGLWFLVPLRRRRSP